MGMGHLKPYTDTARIGVYTPLSVDFGRRGYG